MIVDAQKQENVEEIVFKDYYSSLDDDKKLDLFMYFVPKYMSMSSFYRKIRDNSFSNLEFERIEELTTKKFKR